MDVLWLECKVWILHTIIVQKLEIFYKNSKNVGMAREGQKQLKAVTQCSINHGLYIQGCKTNIRCNILACRDHESKC